MCLERMKERAGANINHDPRDRVSVETLHNAEIKDEVTFVKFSFRNYNVKEKFTRVSINKNTYLSLQLNCKFK